MNNSSFAFWNIEIDSFLNVCQTDFMNFNLLFVYWRYLAREAEIFLGCDISFALDLKGLSGSFKVSE